MKSKLNILILGSGVSGLTTALTILQSSDHEVTIWSREKNGQFPVNSSEAFALWLPHRDVDLDPRIKGWAEYTLKIFKNVAEIPDSGITMMPTVILRSTADRPWYADEYGFVREAETDEFRNEYAAAWVLDPAPVIDPSDYLTWMQMNVSREGGKFVHKEIKNLVDVPKQFDLIINCTGLGSQDLASDKDLKSARMQVVTVKNKSKFKKAVVDEEGHNKPAYIVPQGQHLKLGTVYEEDSDNAEVDANDTRDILDRCSKMVPDLTFSEEDVVDTTVFFAPIRDMVRIEPETLPDGRTLIHNYGHRRTGFITSHGIAKEIAKLIG